MYFCFKVLYGPLLTSEVIYYGRVGCLWMTQKKWKKELLVNSKVPSQKAYKKTTQTHTTLLVNVIHLHRNLEYLTSLRSTAAFNICLQYTDNCQMK
jgi:hypothetical protein